MAWTDETKKQAVEAYLAAKPTPENSTEIIKEIAEDMNESANGVRMILVNADVYVKKNPSAVTKTTKEGSTPRVSKESQILALKSILKDNGVEVDEEILDKLTGKAATYFVNAFKVATSDE